MIKTIKIKTAAVFRKNLKGYILLIVTFIAGAVLSLLLDAKTSEEEIRLFFKDYLNDVKASGTDFFKTFNVSLLNYMKCGIFMLLSSLSVVGAPAILVYTLIEGVSTGAVMFCLFKTFGAKAFLIFFTTIFPHSLIAVPCIISYALLCVRNSVSLINKKNDIKTIILTPLIYGILFALSISVASLIQGYVEPLLVKLIVSQFV